MVLRPDRQASSSQSLRKADQSLRRRVVICVSAPRTALPSLHSTKRRSPPVAKTTESPGQEATMILIMRRLFWIQMGIASKPCHAPEKPEVTR
jgi:hypothetical protein